MKQKNNFYPLCLCIVPVLEARNTDDGSKGKEPEKKPNIVKDYVCLRDGELCHPEFGRNRGIYVSCSNGVPWEQQCPKCSYHPLNCPTRSLWFDGEKCEWASPKLASQPCIDRFAVPEFNQTEKDASHGNVLSEQESLLQSLQVAPMSIHVGGPPMKEAVDRNKWQSSMGTSYFKSPKSGDLQSEPEQGLDAPVAETVKDAKAVPEAVSAEYDSSEEDSHKNQRKGEESEAEFPTYLNGESNIIGSKIVRLSDPVYTLVNNPDGSGKQVLMRVSQPFVLEDPARAILPNMNVISSLSDKE